MELDVGNTEVIVLMNSHETDPGNNNSTNSETSTRRRAAAVSSLRDDLNANENHKPSQPSSLLRKRQLLRRLSSSKPKSRTVEFHVPPRRTTTFLQDKNKVEDVEQLLLEEERSYGAPSSANTSSDDDNDSDFGSMDEDGSESNHPKKRKWKKKKKLNCRIITEWILFLSILTCLICSLTIPSIKRQFQWGIEVWKWCIMLMVIFSGRLVSGWVMCFLVFLIERNFMLREKVLYFVYGLRKSFQNCVWLGLVLMSWTCMFNAKMHKKHKVLRKLFEALVAILVGATIWLLKIVLVKMLASSFHVRTYFDRMKESVFHHYILETLSGPPMDEEIRQIEEERHRQKLRETKSLPTEWKKSKKMDAFKSKKYGTRKIDIEKLRKLSMERTTSAWSVKRLMNYVRFSGLSTISKTVDEFGKAESEITSEWEARNSAKRIFKNVAKPGAKYIDEEDLTKFLKREELHTIFPLFEGALETGRITKSSFRNWLVRAYFERKSLAHSLNDTKTAVQQLHKLASGIVIVIIAVVTVLVMGLATTKVIAVVITHMLLLGFMFQNMCKTVFECIIFVFVMHPFDIGDRCVVDGVHMIVEEMNILSTVFLRYDMEKIYYPNSALLTKPISNFYRSPEMSDVVQFNINASTPIETINAFKTAIKSYIENKPKYWNPKHAVIVKEIEDLNNMKMLLAVQHTINHQNYGERNVRMTELILELKRIFETLGIKYHLLPQDINLTQFNFGNNNNLPNNH